jgi:lipoprotein-anchoring transpeptidase ErfK/SrfK
MRSKNSVVFLLIVLLLAGGLLFRYLYLPRLREGQLEDAAELVRTGDDRGAIPLLRELAGRAPFSPEEGEVALLLARALTRVGDHGPAAEIWEELAVLGNPDLREEALFHLALTAARGGDPVRLDSFLAGYPHSLRAPEARLARSRLREAAGDTGGAEEDYRQVIASSGPEEVQSAARRELGRLSLSRLFSRESGPQTIPYTVRSGDSLTAIARRHRTTPDLVQKMNRLPSDIIHPGQSLNLPAESFAVRISKSENTLTLLYGKEFFREYPVGTGQDNSSPVGEFTIVTKLIDPPWIHGGEVIPPFDDRNILGTRWMGFDDPYAAYGIHGTTQPETVGSQSSDGCVRMRNEDAEELFIFLPRGTKVVIED